MRPEIEERVVQFKAFLGQRKLEVLNALFEASESLSEGVGGKRFRVNHPDWMRDLDELESLHTLIEQSRDPAKMYRVKPYALPLLSSPYAQDIVSTMDRLLPCLRQLYGERLDEKVFVGELEALGVVESALLRDALYMMVECHAFFGGRSAHFPASQDDYAIIRESVIQTDCCLEELTRYYEQRPIGLDAMAAVSALQNFSDVERIELPSVLQACKEKIEDLDFLSFLDEYEQKVLIEVDGALESGLSALSMMGIRALVDYFIRKQVGDVGSFTRGLVELHKAGFISKKDQEILAAVFDMGNATIHRGHFPSVEDVATCVDIYGHLVRVQRDLKGKAELLKRSTPQRYSPSPADKSEES